VKDKPVLTNEEKILLNLQHLISYAEEFEVPPRMTQEGMAKYLGAARPNITRSLKNLQRKGYIDERLAHIIGHRRRKKVYSLTPTGMIESERLERSLRKNLGLEEGDGRSVLEVYFGGPGIDAISVKREPRRELPRTAPKLSARPFFGRTGELGRMNEWLKGSTPYFLVITGIAGIGKTTLARKFLDELDVEHIWHQFHEANTLEGMLHQLGLRLSLVGANGLIKLTSNPSTIIMRDNTLYGEALTNDLWGGNYVLAFDDFHLASPRVATFFNVLLRILDEKDAENVKVVITSRKKGDFYNRGDVKVNGRVVEVDLEGLDMDSSRSLLESKGVPLDHFQRIYSMTRGHPLALELTDASEEMDPHKDALEYVREEIFQKFSEEEKGVVENMAVYRYPVPRGWLVKQGSRDSEVLDNLVDRSVVRYISMGYELHGLIKEFTYDRLGQEDKVKQHDLAAKFYMENSQDYLDELETIHHLIRAGDAFKGAEMLAERAEEMIGEGFFEVSYVLEELEGKILEPPLEVWKNYIRGALLAALGEGENARKYLRKAQDGLEKLPSEERPRLELRLFDKLGMVESSIGEVGKAESFYSRAHKAFKGIKKPTAQDDLVYANTLNDHALLLKNSGKTKEGEDSYRKGIIVLTGPLEDSALMCTIRYNLARLLEDDGRLQEAVSEYEQGLEMAEATGNDHLMVNYCNALGEINAHMKKWDKALEFFERGLSHACMTRDVLDTTKVYLEMANMYTESMSPKGFLGKFKAYFSDKGLAEAENISHLYERISSLYMRRRDWKGAKQFHIQAVDMFKANSDLRMEAKAHNNLGFIHKQRKDYDQAIDEYNKALDIITKGEERKAKGITLFNIGAAYDAKGDTGKREQFFKRAKEIFKKEGMKKQLKILEEW
jgi:tetratricopeptide (TPR) repeat protein/DNA-binding MarR family transcriptional regulator